MEKSGKLGQEKLKPEDEEKHKESPVKTEPMNTLVTQTMLDVNINDGSGDKDKSGHLFGFNFHLIVEASTMFQIILVNNKDLILKKQIQLDSQSKQYLVMFQGLLESIYRV